MCNALQPSLFANRMSAPNFTSNFTSSKFPSMTDWCRAVCPSGPKELTLNSQLVMFCSSEWSSFVLPFFTASWKTLCGAEQVDTSAWLMVQTQVAPDFHCHNCLTSLCYNHTELDRHQLKHLDLQRKKLYLKQVYIPKRTEVKRHTWCAKCSQWLRKNKKFTNS